jgi:hypothetical protein
MQVLDTWTTTNLRGPNTFPCHKALSPTAIVIIRPKEGSSGFQQTKRHSLPVWEKNKKKLAKFSHTLGPAGRSTTQ